jgi:hypothetical protein
MQAIPSTSWHCLAPPRPSRTAAIESSFLRFAIWLALAAVVWAFGYSLGYQTAALLKPAGAAVANME